MTKLEDSSKSYIMVIKTSDYLNRLEANQFNLFTQKLHNSIFKSIDKFRGHLLSHNDNSYATQFDSVTNTILCALRIQQKFKYSSPTIDNALRKLKIGIVAVNKSIKNAEKKATDFCEILKDQIVITTEVKHDYVKENRNTFINKDHIRVLRPSEEAFLINLVHNVESIWSDSTFSVDILSQPLNYSNSQVYRKMVSLTGKAPSAFIKSYRLNKALKLIHDRKGNITDIAKSSGFKSGSYFSKCFKEKFGIKPTKYLKQHAI